MKRYEKFRPSSPHETHLCANRTVIASSPEDGEIARCEHVPAEHAVAKHHTDDGHEESVVQAENELLSLMKARVNKRSFLS